MRTLKKVSLLVVALLFTFGISNAQVGIQAGVGTSKTSTFDKAVKGFHVGPTYNMTIQGPVSLEYALLYNYLVTNDDYASITESNITAHRLDVPFRVNAGFPLGSSVKLYIFAGPNFNFGLKESRKGGYWGGSGQHDNIYDIKEANGKHLYSRFDLQIGGGAGLEFGKVGLRASYDLGLLDRDNRDSYEWKNDDLKLSLTVKF